MNTLNLRVLIVDDEESLRRPLAERLRDIYGYAVDTAADGEKALQLLEASKGTYDVILIDQVLEGDIGGLDLLREVKSRFHDIQAIVFTGWGMEEGANVLRQGAYRYFAKPFNYEELALTIQFAVEESHTKKERQYMAELVRVGRGLTRTIDLDEQLQLVWEFVRKQLDVSTFFIGLFSSEEKTISFPLVYDDGKMVAKDRINLQKDRDKWGVAGYVVTSGIEILWSDLEEKEKICREKGITPLDEGKPSVSAFFLPLRIGNRILGVMSAQSYNSHAFTIILLNALRALSSQLAAALENSRLFAEMEQSAKDIKRQAFSLAALQRLALMIGSSLDPGEILTKTCQIAVEFFQADHSGLVLFDPNCEFGVVLAEYPDLDTRDLRIPLRGIQIEESLINSRQPVQIYDVEAEPSLGPVKDILVSRNIRSTLFVPVIGKGGVLGSFSLDAVQHQRYFAEEEISLCKTFADQVAVAIENARAYQEIQEGREYLHSLYKASSDIISPRHPEKLLKRIVEAACEATGAWRAVILLVDEGGHPTVLAASGFDFSLDTATSIRDHGVSRQIMRNGEPRFFQDVNAHVNELHPDMLAQGVKAAACVPLFLSGHNIGVIWIHFLEPHIFSETEKQALQVFANQSAIAYDNARRMEQLEQLRLAAEAMSEAADPKAVLQVIVERARHVLKADYSLIWSYDDQRNIFLPEELVADGVSEEWLETFRVEEPKAGKTTRYVLNKGYVNVSDLTGSQVKYLGEPTRSFLRDLGVTSFQSIRLAVAGERLGVLHVDYKRPHEFGLDEHNLLGHFADLAALTLKKARLLAQVNQAREAARIVAQVTTLGNLTETLKIIVKGARQVLNCDIATLYTFDEKENRFVYVEGEGYRERNNLRPPEEIASNSSLWRMIKLGPPYYRAARNASKDKLLQGSFVHNEDVRSALGIQLRFGEQRVGVMFVNYRTSHRFTEEEIQNALQFGNQAAVAIRNAQLHEDVQKRVDVLSALYEAGKTITSTLTLDETLNRIALQALHIIGVSCQEEGCFSHIALRDGSRLQFEAASSPKILTLLKNQIIIDLEKSPKIGIAGRCVKTGIPQIINNVHDDPDYIPLVDNTIQKIVTTHSQLSVPLRAGEQIIGVLSIEHPRLGAFSDDDSYNLELLSAQASVAIPNARKYRDAERLLASRTALAWMGILGSTWQHAIQKHAITIREQIELLRGDLRELSKDEKFTKRLDIVERLANKILEKPLTPPLSAEEGVYSVSINEFIIERIDHLRNHHQSVDFIGEYMLKEPASIRISPEWLRRAFDILIDNAVDATQDLPKRQITIRTQRENRLATILIRDNGRGIPEEVLNRLFSEPIPKTQGAKGHGMGLMLAQMILQTYGGEIRVGETGPEGTTMVVSIPLEY